MEQFPVVGLGTFGAKDPAVVEEVLSLAIEDVGYRSLDTAASYSNEEVIGAALQRIFARGKVKREDLFITTKLANICHRPELVEPALRESLRKLQLGYVDLYLMHWPLAEVIDKGLLAKPNFQPLDGVAPRYEHIDILDTWGAMEGLVAKGLAKRIGVSNFTIEMLERMEFSPRVTIQPFANQVPFSLYNQQPALLAYLERRGIALTAYSPLGGLPGRPGPFGTALLEDAVLREVAKETGRTPAQVALKHLLSVSPVVRVIPKSATPSRVRENFQLDFELTAEQLAKLKARNVLHRFFDPFDLTGGVDVLSLGR